MEATILIGRIVFSMIFVGAGIGHMADEASTTAATEKAGLPNAKVLGQVSGALLLVGGLAIITGFWIDLAAAGLAVLVLIMSVTMHQFWKFEGEEQQLQMSLFMKNLSIIGGCVIIFGFYAYGWDKTTIVGPLFDL